MLISTRSPKRNFSCDPCDDSENIPGPIFDPFYTECINYFIAFITANVPDGLTVSSPQCLNCPLGIGIYSNGPVSGPGIISLTIKGVSNPMVLTFSYTVTNKLGCSRKYFFSVEFVKESDGIPCEEKFKNNTADQKINSGDQHKGIKSIS